MPHERRFMMCNGEVVKYSDLFRATGGYKSPNHIIGEVIAVTMEGRKVTALARWKRSFPADRVPPINPDLAERAIIEARGICCLAVGCQRAVDWYASKTVLEASFQRLMRHYPSWKDGENG